MSGRHSASDYPEHLNPFKKRSGLRGSFRELKKTLTRTFRRKDDDRSAIQTRHNIAAVAPPTRHSEPESVVLRQNGTPVFKEKVYKSEMYPRSRFSERVAMSQREPTATEGSLTKEETNPFGEEEEVDTSKIADDSITSNSSNVFTKRRRRKKRAPLPPNMLGTSNGLQVPYKSDWSINSYDTDCSSHYCSEADLEHAGNKENLKEITEISSEIIGFCKEVNSKDDEVGEVKGAMPDLVVSSDGVGSGATSNSLEGNTQEEASSAKNESKDADFNTSATITAIEDVGKAGINVAVTVQGGEANGANATESRGGEGNAALVETPQEDKSTGAAVDGVEDATEEIAGLIETPQEDKITGVAVDGVEGATNEIAGLIEGPQEDKSTGVAVDGVEGATEEIGVVVNSVVENGTAISGQQQSEIVILDKALEMIGDCKIADDVGAASLDCLVDEDEVVSDVIDEEELLDICHDHTVDICIPEDTVLDDEVGEDQNNNNHEKREINYVESKTMYILGSKDDLDKEINYNEKTSLYISGSRDELNEQSNPVPKIRKHKLSKAALLGSGDEINATATN